jgi:hypothetical protein
VNSKHKALVLTAVVGAAVTLAWSKPVTAATFFFLEPGSLCQNSRAQVASDDLYDPFRFSPMYGAYNGCGQDCSPTYQVVCPVVSEVNGVNASQGIKNLNASVYDRSTTDDVVCTFYTFDMDGNVIWSGTQRTSASQGPAYSLGWTPTGGGQIGALWCDVPPNTGSGFSHVANYFVTLTR